MFNSPILEVAIGLSLIFLLVSLLVSTLCEILAGVFRWRAATLWSGLEQLLQSPVARDKLYNHPLIKGLAPIRMNARAVAQGSGGPSYIPSRVFALALVDSLKDPRRLPDEVRKGLAELASTAHADVTALRAAADKAFAAIGAGTLPGGLPADLSALKAQVMSGGTVDEAAASLRKFLEGRRDVQDALTNDASLAGLAGSLRPLFEEAGGDIDRFRRNIEIWFNDGMDRVSGAYKRRATGWQMAIGLVLAVTLNVDALLITRTLWRDPALRQSLVSEAEAVAKQPPASLVPPARKVSTAEGDDKNAVTAEVSAPQVGPGETPSIAVQLPASDHERTVAIDVETAYLLLGQGQTPPTEESAWSKKVTLTVKAGEPTARVFAKLSADAKAESLETYHVVVTDAATAGAKPIELRGKVLAMPSADERFEALRSKLGTLGLPFGWKACGKGPADADSALATPLIWCTGWPWNWLGILTMLLGWAITAAAVSLGAPFWFDFLKRFVSIRATGKAPEEQPLPPKEVPKPRDPQPGVR